jgi:hypothetical protein
MKFSRGSRAAYYCPTTHTTIPQILASCVSWVLARGRIASKTKGARTRKLTISNDYILTNLERWEIGRVIKAAFVPFYHLAASAISPAQQIEKSIWSRKSSYLSAIC